jgi:hypothetical protein
LDFRLSIHHTPTHIRIQSQDAKMVESSSDESKLHFNGANWEDLDRMLALARFQFLQDDDYDDNSPRRCAYLAARFTGPALDWVGSQYSREPVLFENYEVFVARVKEAFGVEANNVTALRRKALDNLRWDREVPTFFANFDRLTFQLGITDHGTKIAMVQSKLPIDLKAKLAEQALDFANYDTMRERLNTMWALDPHRQGQGTGGTEPTNKKPRCGSCGKKGHTAKDCRGVNK